MPINPLNIWQQLKENTESAAEIEKALAEAENFARAQAENDKSIDEAWNTDIMINNNDNYYDSDADDDVDLQRQAELAVHKLTQTKSERNKSSSDLKKEKKKANKKVSLQWITFLLSCCIF
jgi:hypothetical protein